MINRVAVIFFEGSFYFVSFILGPNLYKGVWLWIFICWGNVSALEYIGCYLFCYRICRRFPLPSRELFKIDPLILTVAFLYWKLKAYQPRRLILIQLSSCQIILELNPFDLGIRVIEVRGISLPEWDDFFSSHQIDENMANIFQAVIGCFEENLRGPPRPTIVCPLDMIRFIWLYLELSYLDNHL